MTAVADPALGFWLRHVAAAGGLWELDGDVAYVVLPPLLRDAYRLPEELRVTADPDVAREDRATLLGSGCAVPARSGPGGWPRSRRNTRRATSSGRTGCTYC